MDRTNRRLMRLEALVGLTAAASLALAHLGEIRWPVFIGLFAAIDLVGFIPGALAQARARGERPKPIYYALYNATHNFATAAVLTLGWALAVRPEWALLAVPLHLWGDRALFGNFFKPLEGSFA